MIDLYDFSVHVYDDITVFINGDGFDFMYTVADSVVKEKYKGKYRWIGGLSCNYEKNTEEYKELEGKLCRIAEIILNK